MEENRFCQCCYESKPQSKFYVNKVSKTLTHFCKKCYKDYTIEERNANQMKFVISSLKGIEI